MKTKVKLNSIFRSNDRQVLVLENETYFDLELEQDKEYEIEIKEWKSSRTKRQNSYMWTLIHELAKVWNEDDMNIYCKAIEDVGAKYEDIIAITEAEKNMKEGFRAVRILRPIWEKGRKYYVYRCYLGSSKFNKKEMGLLIDKIIEWASECGINTDYYVEMMK